jgi:hypothetical protein
MENQPPDIIQEIMNRRPAVTNGFLAVTVLIIVASFRFALSAEVLSRLKLPPLAGRPASILSMRGGQGNGIRLEHVPGSEVIALEEDIARNIYVWRAPGE